MCVTYVEPWSNHACLGFVISALENLEYEPEKISEVVMELGDLFDWFTVEDAEEYYNESGYSE